MSRLPILATAGMLAAAMFVPTFAQQELPKPPKAPEPVRTLRSYAVPGAATIPRFESTFSPSNFSSTNRFHFGSNKESRAANNKVSKASAALAKAKPEDRAEMRSSLEEAVRELFDVRTKEREKQISDLEARIKKLRKQLTKRSDARDEIVRLKVQSLVNDAEGLGF